MSKIAEEISLLDKLAWARFPTKVQIARAAYMLRKRGYSCWHLDDDKEAKRELRLLVHKTAPGKGKILAREDEIKAEVRRQYMAARSEKPYSPSDEPSVFRDAVMDKGDRKWHKSQLIRRFGDKLGISGLNAFLKKGDAMLLFAGGWNSYRELFIRRRYGAPVYKIHLNENNNYERIEELLADLPRLLLNDPDPVGVLSDIVIRGAQLSLDWHGFKTIVTFPDGSERLYRWRYDYVSPYSMDRYFNS